MAVVANPTSQIAGVPLVDSLLHSGILVIKVFGPEHGFRGNASNGANVADSHDPVTGIPIVSLYGQKSMPSQQDLKDVDIVVFDIQDVGARFFTYIITLQHVMQACAMFHKPMLILYRPNPNGYMVDGPVLEDHWFWGRTSANTHRTWIYHSRAGTNDQWGGLDAESCKM